LAGNFACARGPNCARDQTVVEDRAWPCLDRRRVDAFAVIADEPRRGLSFASKPTASDWVHACQ